MVLKFAALIHTSNYVECKKAINLLRKIYNFFSIGNHFNDLSICVHAYVAPHLLMNRLPSRAFNYPYRLRYRAFDVWRLCPLAVLLERQVPAAPLTIAASNNNLNATQATANDGSLSELYSLIYWNESDKILAILKYGGLAMQYLLSPHRRQWYRSMVLVTPGSQVERFRACIAPPDNVLTSALIKCGGQWSLVITRAQRYTRPKGVSNCGYSNVCWLELFVCCT